MTAGRFGGTTGEMLVGDSNLRQQVNYWCTATSLGTNIGRAAGRGVGPWSGGVRNGQKEAIAIHDDSNRCVLIFCQIRDFQSYNANKKSNKSI